MLCFPLSACSSNSSSNQSENEAQNQAAQQVGDACDEFRLVVSAEEWSGGSISVHITGQSDSGKNIDETLVVKPDVQQTVLLGPGTYNLVVETNAMASASDALVAKAKAEQEAKATAEKAAAEQAAAEKAAAEQAAAEQVTAEQQAAEEEATASQNNTATVYITKTGECYHRRAGEGVSTLQKLQSVKLAGQESFFWLAAYQSSRFDDVKPSRLLASETTIGICLRIVTWASRNQFWRE